jgi:hypothetical protein
MGKELIGFFGRPGELIRPPVTAQRGVSSARPGYVLLGIFFCVAMPAIPTMFIVRAPWLSQRLLPWYELASILSFWLLILVLLPLAAFRRSRTSRRLRCLSCHMYSVLPSGWKDYSSPWALWGILAVVVGLFVAGVGVLIAILALFKECGRTSWSLLC